ncbi:hypothetical protein P7C73_g6808, partial [Tremellales sp. Uapishka_1]
SSPLPLSAGELLLTLLPANPPTTPAQTLTLTIGASSFPLLPNSPVQKVKANDQHSSYVFSPVPADGGASIGQVKIVMKPSENPGEWEATEALCHSFETALQAQGVWSEKTLFVDDEFETASPALHTSGSTKGWGESIAGVVAGASSAIAERISSYTDRHIATTDPTHPAPPSDAVAANAKSASSATHTISEYAASTASAIGSTIHSAGKAIGDQLPDSVAKPAEPVADADKTEIRRLAEDGWEQISLAAKGVANAAITVGGAVSENAHKAVEHNFGKKAESVAQDVGQSGQNLGATGLAVMEGTSMIMQGKNAATGAYASSEERK